MEKALYPCDLHTHTVRSDGADTPEELIAAAADRNMKVLAITDHDLTPDDYYIDAEGNTKSLTELAASKGISLILGTEISCETEVEDVHIVCLGCDWSDSWFESMEKDVAKSKVESYKRLVKCLQADGMHITWDELLVRNGQKIDEKKIAKKTIFEMIAKKGYTKDWSEAKLLVKNTKRYQVKRRKPNPEMVIKEVHRTGGIAILAHPFLISEEVNAEGSRMTREEYIENLLEAGLDGIEACYSYDKTSYEGCLSKTEVEAYIREHYESRVRIISGGSDYHADQKKGSTNPRKIGECGVTEAYFKSNKYLACLI